MNSPVGQIRQGQICWMSVNDGRGNTKRRPVVVLTRDCDIVLDTEIVVVAVSTQIPDPPRSREVILPHGGSWPHPTTRLHKRCAAVCDWLCRVRPSDLEPTDGYVPGKTMLRIIEAVRECGDNSPGRDGTSDGSAERL